jgi:hypothetical protein
MAYIKSQLCSIWRQDDEASPLNTYVQIGQVTSIDGPTASQGFVDVTHLSSTAREFITSLPDWGNVSISVIWDPVTASVQHDELYADFVAGNTVTYQIRLSNSPATELTFSAIIIEHPISIAVDDKVGATITLKTTGAVTLT